MASWEYPRKNAIQMGKSSNCPILQQTMFDHPRATTFTMFTLFRVIRVTTVHDFRIKNQCDPIIGLFACGGFHKFGYRQSSSISRWDVPFYKPTVFCGIPMETPRYHPLSHRKLRSFGAPWLVPPCGSPDGWKAPSRWSDRRG